jgi:hypothetical protein
VYFRAVGTVKNIQCGQVGGRNATDLYCNGLVLIQDKQVYINEYTGPSKRRGTLTTDPLKDKADGALFLDFSTSTRTTTWPSGRTRTRTDARGRSKSADSRRTQCRTFFRVRKFRGTKFYSTEGKFCTGLPTWHELVCTYF